MAVSTFRLLSLAGAGGLVCLLLPGCGVELAPSTVSGEVTYRSKPIERGAIKFVPAGVTTSSGGVGEIADGKYSILTDGLLEGEYVVMISGFKETGRITQIEPGVKEVKEVIQYLPQKFNADSLMRVTLQAGKNIHDFKLPD